jgi:hypothetical protein
MNALSKNNKRFIGNDSVIGYHNVKFDKEDKNEEDLSLVRIDPYHENIKITGDGLGDRIVSDPLEEEDEQNVMEQQVKETEISSANIISPDIVDEEKIDEDMDINKTDNIVLEEEQEETSDDEVINESESIKRRLRTNCSSVSAKDSIYAYQFLLYDDDFNDEDNALLTEDVFMSYAQSISKYGEKAIEAGKAELLQLEEREVWIPLSEEEIRKLLEDGKEVQILPSHMIAQEKYDSHGQLIKIKDRYVAGGHKQDKSLY